MTEDVYSVDTTRTYHHGDLRRALIDAGLEVLGERGADALTLREVARRAGVSAMAPYRHFADKAALLASIAERGLEMFFAVIAEADGATDPRRALVQQGVAYVEFALDHPALFGLMFGHKPAGPGLPADDGAVTPANGFVTFRRRVSTIVPPDQAEQALFTAWSFVHGFAALALDGRIPDPRRTIRGAAEFLVERMAQG
jgi:AcrR family transcriptional regulator